MKRKAVAHLQPLQQSAGYFDLIWAWRHAEQRVRDRAHYARFGMPYPNASMPAPVRKPTPERKSLYPSVRAIAGGKRP